MKIHDMMIRSRIGTFSVIPFVRNTTALLLSTLLLVTGISASPAASAEAPHTIALPAHKAQGTAPQGSAETPQFVTLAQEILSELHAIIAPPSTPDYSSAAALAISLSYPLYGPSK